VEPRKLTGGVGVGMEDDRGKEVTEDAQSEEFDLGDLVDEVVWSARVLASEKAS
jgi:hypothetical protein